MIYEIEKTDENKKFINEFPSVSVLDAFGYFYVIPDDEYTQNLFSMMGFDLASPSRAVSLYTINPRLYQSIYDYVHCHLEENVDILMLANKQVTFYMLFGDYLNIINKDKLNPFFVLKEIIPLIINRVERHYSKFNRISKCDNIVCDYDGIKLLVGDSDPKVAIGIIQRSIAEVKYNNLYIGASNSVIDKTTIFVENMYNSIKKIYGV